MLEFFAFPGQLPGLDARIAVAVAFTGAAAYYDIFNKRWVPNWLVYCFAAAAVAVNLLFFSEPVFFQAMLFGIAVFALTYPLYRLGQLGGADVFVFASIAAAIPCLPTPLLAPSQQIPYPFILSVLVPTGLAFIFHMALRFIPYISKRIACGKVRLGIAKLAGPAMVSAAFALFVFALMQLPVSLPLSYIATIAFLFVSLLFFSIFKDEIKESMVEPVSIGKLQAEDVLALEQMDGKVIKRLRLPPLICKETISKLKAAKIRAVPVYTGMPAFLPYLFLGLLFSVLFGDLLHYIV
ncbi:MAG: A24 family peptidase [Candidatus Micrarchaeia archaeon]